MRRAELAKRLIAAADERERRDLLTQNRKLADKRLSDRIRSLCYATWTTEPVKARRAAAAMRLLAKMDTDAEVQAAAFWVAGIADITRGNFEKAAISLEKAAATLKDIAQEHKAAQAQVAQLLALAMLGRYDEALITGRRALRALVRAGDDLGAGKIEMNLSNIASRRSQHAEAVKYCDSARRRFIKAGETSWQAMAENGLANSYMELNRFAKAESHYKAALDIARKQKMHVTEAEIEASLGNLALMRGDLSVALRRLETSRQRYAALDMPHQSAIAELEIADIYAELNLTDEASEIYDRVAAIFARLKLRGEEARARLNFGRLQVRTGILGAAKRSLKKAQKLFEREKNLSGSMASLLALAEAELVGPRSVSVQKLFNSAIELAALDEDPRSSIRLEILRGIAKLKAGNIAGSSGHLNRAVSLAKKHKYAEALRVGETWLGRASCRRGELEHAKKHFRRAIGIVERQRGSLANQELNMAFSASRLDAYADLGKILLQQKRLGSAFEVFEMGRSRSLLDHAGTRQSANHTAAKLMERAAAARAELNFLYRRADVSPREEMVKLRPQIANSEKLVADLDRQINSLAASAQEKKDRHTHLTLSDLQTDLTTSTSLVEYVILDGQIGAFIVTSDEIAYLPAIANESEIAELLDGLHFQLDTARYGSAQLARFADQVKARTDQILAELYDKLFRPLATHIRGDRLLVVAAGPLHYVPFCALFDGKDYLVEKFDIRLSPSAAIWRRLVKKRRRTRRRTLLIGFADERIPLVENEIRTIAKILPNATRFTGRAATFSAFSANAANHDILHIACHGQFRPDNPMFSSLHLADGWVTVRDLVAKKIPAELVTMSACETGVSKVFAGEEILGLARGFLSAGAQSMIASLWAVNDTAATKMMPQFYKEIAAGAPAAIALRRVQLQMIAGGAHPSLWAAFFYIGA